MTTAEPTPDKIATIADALYIQVRNFAHGAIFQRQFEENIRELVAAALAAERERREVQAEALKAMAEEIVGLEAQRDALAEALRAAIQEVHSHNAEYHHHTPEATIGRWFAILKAAEDKE